MNHYLQSLGWTLLHFCWQAAAIALVYWLADVALSKARSQTRYLLALGAMLLTLLSALSTLAYEETQGNPELFSPSALSNVANATAGSSISTGSGAVGTTEPRRRYNAACSAPSVSTLALAGCRVVAGCGVPFDPNHRRLAHD